MKNHATALFCLALFSILLCSATSTMAESIKKLLVDIYGFTLENSSTEHSTQFYASAGSRFDIVNEYADSILVVRFTGAIDSPGSLAPDSTSIRVEKEVNYLISTKILNKWSYELAFEFAWGMLTIPMRIQLTDGNMTSAATVATYFGRRQTIFHIPFSVIATFGATAIPIAYSGVEDDLSTKMGWTYALGVLLEPESNFQVGFLFGRDHVVGDAGDEYPYQNKTWFSFTIGINM